MQKLEYPYEPVSIKSLQKHDAIVVLSGGGVRKVGKGDNERYELSNSSRFFAAIELIKSFKSDQLIFTAGQVPWTANWKPEGIYYKDKAKFLGINETNIFVTKETKNTYDESIAVTKLISKYSSIILVTSAFHMNRSLYLFKKQGFNVTPFPVDFRSSNFKISILNFLPNSGAIGKASLYIRENIGRIYYKLFL
tara:strand:- start:145 stop:726 length:582 start_codon:yes stop_codon:yes gene_type:complete